MFSPVIETTLKRCDCILTISPMIIIQLFSFFCISWLNRKKLPLFITMVTTCSLILSFGMSLCFLHVSRHNYPGGHALSRLHQLVGMEMEREMGQWNNQHCMPECTVYRGRGALRLAMVTIVQSILCSTTILQNYTV